MADATDRFDDMDEDGLRVEKLRTELRLLDRDLGERGRSAWAKPTIVLGVVSAIVALAGFWMKLDEYQRKLASEQAATQEAQRGEAQQRALADARSERLARVEPELAKAREKAGRAEALEATNAELRRSAEEVRKALAGSQQATSRLIDETKELRAERQAMQDRLDTATRDHLKALERVRTTDLEKAALLEKTGALETELKRLRRIK